LQEKWNGVDMENAAILVTDGLVAPTNEFRTIPRINLQTTRQESRPSKVAWECAAVVPARDEMQGETPQKKAKVELGE
jgi:hypothetical protein